MRLLTSSGGRGRERPFLTKEVILFFSILILWVVETFHFAQMSNFDFDFFSTWIFTGLGAAIWRAIVGIVLGGFVLFNIFLFICNILRPRKKLSFNYFDKMIAGTWLAIIFGLINLFK